MDEKTSGARRHAEVVDTGTITHMNMSAGELPRWLEDVKWNNEGLVPVIAQDRVSGRVLMLAWMNREALHLTAKSGKAVYWSRSRGCLWRKGESSGHVQHVHELRLDCDGDALLLQVDQDGGIACHTGRESCFYNMLETDHWVALDPVLKNPKDIYK